MNGKIKRLKNFYTIMLILSLCFFGCVIAALCFDSREYADVSVKKGIQGSNVVLSTRKQKELCDLLLSQELEEIDKNQQQEIFYGGKIYYVEFRKGGKLFSWTISQNSICCDMKYENGARVLKKCQNQDVLIQDITKIIEGSREKWDV